MFVVLASSLAVFGGWGIVVFVLVVGLAICFYRIEPGSPWAYFALIVICLLGLAALLMPGIESAREASRLAACRSRMFEIALALRNYHSENGCFPPAYIVDKNGKPMHSWRVLILPEMEYDSLYRTYDLAQPWDGPKNKKLAAVRLSEYVCPSEPSTTAPGGESTSYVAVVGNGVAWAGETSSKSTDVSNDPSHTVMLIEVANSGIAWSEPRDFSLDTLNVSGAESPPMTLASHRVGHSEFFFIYDAGTGIHIAMADGSVHFLRTDCLSSEELRKVLAIGGCKNVAGGPHVALDEDDWRLNWPNIAALAVWLLSVGLLLVGAVRSRKAKPA